MALGKSQQFDGKSYSLRLKLKDGAQFLDCAEFDVQEKQGDKYVSVQKTRDVGGDLFRVETREGEYQGEPILTCKLGLRDNALNEAYFVEFGLGSTLGRGLANSILNLKAFEKVDIGLYPQKSQRDGKTYSASALRQGGSKETVKWAYDPAAGVLPPAREFKGKGGKIEKDYSEQERFLFEKLTEFGTQFGKANEDISQTEKPVVAPKQTTAAKSTKPTAAPVTVPPVDEDVPF